MNDITLINLNMLIVRYIDAIEKELHVVLGPLYLVSALEKAGFKVDFRDYQICEYEEPFSPENLADFCKDSAEIIGISCMGNLLPFTILAAREIKKLYPSKTIVIGGVGPFSIEQKILERFPWIDIVAYGEGERSIVILMEALKNNGDLGKVPGIYYRINGEIKRTDPCERINDLDSIPPPALHHIDLKKYAGINIITSRGCPYGCTFCSVAPIWGRKPFFRKPEKVVREMQMLHLDFGVNLFLFQDEFFVSSKERVMQFCQTLKKSGLKVMWKAFARINLTDTEVMKTMAEAGCVEIRYGIESGSNRILERVKKGFTIEQATEVISEATLYFPRVDSFFIWGFPFEEMSDFYQTIFHMISFRLIGSRILPSLFCMLPQTEIYREYNGKEHLEFYPDLFPEYMLTGHEICDYGKLQISQKHKFIFDFIEQNPDIFPGFFHIDLEKNILPKFEILKEHGFYPSKKSEVKETDSCGAHSPRITREQAIGVITRPTKF